jgi:hypothetical protein
VAGEAEGEAKRFRDPSQVEYGELPELTRALRALGSSRRSGGSLQSQFFLPLLDARRRAAEARGAAACVGAFDPAELRRALDHAIDRIVTQWFDSRSSARRALRAELLERVSSYSRALTELSARATALLSADEPSRLAAWRAWTVQLAATFDAADRSWMALRSVVDSLPVPPKSSR